ncbi:MAG: transcriptional repressor [Bacillota bacterium]|nr:MAG: transcriptional repressor [Bacillota bacterium]
MRLTPARTLVLNLFKAKSSLLCAEDIEKLLKDGSIYLSTIYRALEYFEKENVLGKSTINKTAYYYLIDGRHHHYMICTHCLARFPIDCELEAMINKNIARHNFIPTSHDLTIYGYCEKCAKQQNN